MAFIKKKLDEAGLSKLTQADISVKNSIKKLGDIANSPKNMIPIFIALDKAVEALGSKDPKLTSVIIFGPKVKGMKALLVATVIAKYKALATYGFAYVEYDDKQVPTLVISPEKGDGYKKEALLLKAMKLQFGTAYSNFKIGAEVDAKQAEALEAAAEALPDDVEDAPETTAAPKVEATATPKVDATAKPKTQEEVLTNVIAHVTSLMDKLKKLNEEKADQAELAAAASAVEKALVGAQTGKIV